MITAHSTATSNHEYRPTIIEHRLLIERLVIQLAFLLAELKRSWKDFKKDPAAFVRRTISESFDRLIKLLSTPHLIRATLISIALITSAIVAAVRIGDRPTSSLPEIGELVIVDIPPSVEFISPGLGLDGAGRVGFSNGTGEGSGPAPKRARGGGGGGNHSPIAPQTGELPQPSEIPAPISTAPPINPPALPAAGIDLDPALWKDLKAPVYGDPRSVSQTESKGPGNGEGIGSGNGLGIGEGNGSGVGRGNYGNMGNGYNGMGGDGTGGGGSPGGGGGSSAFYRSVSEVDQRPRVLFKPEPQYTEEARRNQTTGRVVLRVVFASNGEVVQIRAVRSLPFGLTERAIAAARQIRFEPAMKEGHPVSVFMQLEYNFNLY
jgi:TonB family protein